MAKNLQIVVSVRDQATRKLGQVQKKINHTTRATAGATKGFKDFNRTLFATTAFIGTFMKAFSSLSSSIVKGAELDRLENQFERVLGPSSKLLGHIGNFTDAAVDRIEAMRSGIAMANLGIVSSSEEAASIIAMAGAAARQAGIDSGEGVKRVTQFLKDGSVAQLEFLNVLKSTNPQLQAMMSVLSSAGGTMGTVMSTQARLKMGQQALAAATQGTMKGFRDLQDVTKSIGETFKAFSMNLGRLLATSLGPFIDKMSAMFDTLAKGMDNIRENEKEIMFLTKAMVIGTGATLGLAGAIGTLRLSTMALGSLGFGLPMIIGLAATLGGTFSAVTRNANSLTERLKVFGAFLKGVWQLFSSLDEDTGLAKIDKELADLLKGAGIFEFTHNVARAFSVARSFVRGFVDSVSTSINFAISLFEKLVGSIKNLLGMDAAGPWSKSWLTGAESVGKAFGYLGSVVAAFAGLKMAKGVLSKIPGIGRMFGGGKLGASASNPMHVKEVSGFGGMASGLRGLGKTRGGTMGGIGGFLKKWNPFSKGNLSVLLSKLGIFGTGISKLIAFGARLLSPIKFLGSILLRVAGGLLSFPGLLAGAVAAGAGVIIGKAVNRVLDKYTQGETKEGFEGNLVERGFFKLDKLMGGKTTKNFMKHQKMIEDAGIDPSKVQTQTPTGTKSQISIPIQPDAEDEQLDALGNKLKEMESAEKQRFIESIREAKSLSGPGGADITPDEWKNIFLGALEASENLNTIASRVGNTQTPVPMKSRR